MRLLTFMKYCVIFAYMYISRPFYSQQLSQDPLYKLVFSDEFDSLGLNSNKWSTTYHYAFNLLNKNKGSSCAWMGLDTFDYQFNYPGENNRAYDTDSGFIRLIHKKEILRSLWFFMRTAIIIRAIPHGDQTVLVAHAG